MDDLVPNDLTFASWFSGVGGMDRGLETAGWRCVSHSENDPYASAVLAERWPAISNHGDITRWGEWPDGDWQSAALWAGGPPCQDFSVAGKRAGLKGARSGLATTWFDAVGRYRPRAVLLENVPGLLSSHRGRDMAALTGTLVELGYGVGYRTLDARHFGVPQRRRRVFIVGLRPGGRAGAERAAEVLSVGSRCRRHSPTGGNQGEIPAARTGSSPDGSRLWNATAQFGAWEAGDEAGTLSRRDYKSSNHLVGAAPDPGGVRAPDGLAGRLDDRGGVVNALDQRRGGADDNEAQAGHLVVVTSGPKMNRGDDLLPKGLDSHRYRCCGNGVVSSVAEWIGLRLAAELG